MWGQGWGDRCAGRGLEGAIRAPDSQSVRLGKLPSTSKGQGLKRQTSPGRSVEWVMAAALPRLREPVSVTLHDMRTELLLKLKQGTFKLQSNRTQVGGESKTLLWGSGRRLASSRQASSSRAGSAVGWGREQHSPSWEVAPQWFLRSLEGSPLPVHALRGSLRRDGLGTKPGSPQQWKGVLTSD